jgi:hypothetical protein
MFVLINLKIHQLKFSRGFKFLYNWKGYKNNIIRSITPNHHNIKPEIRAQKD